MTFLECLFDSGESTCFSETPRGIAVGPAHQPFKEEAFFSINPLDSKKTRADSSVLKYRNILLEMDKIPLEHQQAIIQGSQMPYSTAVFSGSKSIHYIISLQEPLVDGQLYRSLVKRVYKAIGNDLVDHSCKNPSRFSRLPGHIRLDTGKEQELLYVGERVPLETLEKWLVSRGVGPEEIWDNLTPEARSTFKNPGRLYAGTKNFLMYGAIRGEWNPKLFKASADLCRCGFTQEEAIAELNKVTGHLDSNDLTTITSAFKNELGKNNA